MTRGAQELAPHSSDFFKQTAVNSNLWGTHFVGNRPVKIAFGIWPAGARTKRRNAAVDSLKQGVVLNTTREGGPAAAGRGVAQRGRTSAVEGGGAGPIGETSEIW